MCSNSFWILALDREFAEKLNPFVRERFLDLMAVVSVSRRYYRALASDTPPDVLAAMISEGIVLDETRTTEDWWWLMTDDSKLASKFEMHDESEFMGS